MFKPGKKFFTIILASLAVILVAYGFLRMNVGPFLPKPIDEGLPDFIIFAAVGIMLWNRKILGDDKKAAEARKAAEAAALAAAAEEAAESAESAEPEDKGSDAKD
jgi:hypothetical protein